MSPNCSIPSGPLDELVDPEHQAVLAMFPPNLVYLGDGIPAARIAGDAFLAALPAPELPSTVQIGEVMAPGVDGEPDVRVKTYRPAEQAENAAVLVWIHGGGMVLFGADSSDARCVNLALRTGCPVVSVDYRLAPEHPAPAAVQDCYGALCWAAENASDFGVEPGRTILMGESAGGGLAAGSALWSRDNGGPQALGMVLACPMLDHRNELPSTYAITDGRVWNRGVNVIAWEAYLGGKPATAYSSPLSAEDLTGLPPALVSVSSLDLFLDEDIAFASRLHAAGVDCDLRVHPGGFHGSHNFCPHSPVSQRWVAVEDAFIAGLLT